jgi:hypothetical protein
MSTLSRFMRGGQDIGLSLAGRIAEALGLRLTGGAKRRGKEG